MVELTLGLDLGTTSLGWALVDQQERRILGAGIRIFPEGVDRDQQGGEKSKPEARRNARAMRRQIARRSARLRSLREALVAAGLFPADQEAQGELLSLDPYQLRRRAW